MLRHPRGHLGRLLLAATVAAASQGAVQPARAADQLAMQAKQRLRLKGCGKQVDQIDATLRIEDSPTWSLDLGAPPPGGSSLAGSYAVAGRRDRKVTLQSDAAGVAALTARIGALATALCGSDTGADGVEIKAFKLVRGKKAARFKLTVKFTATTGKRGRLAVRGKGVLEPVSTTTVTSTTVPESTTSTSIAGTSSTTVSSTTLVTSTTLKPTTTVTSTTLKPSTTVTSTTLKPTTTVTTTSSTTTTTVFNECQGVTDGVGCLDDGEVCTRDLCMGEVCTHTTPQVAGFSCRPANGSPCDVADTCTGGLGCPDQKSTAACPGPVPAQLPCHEGGVLFCDGHSDECPPEPLCSLGAPCNADDQCTTGACVQGACAEPAQACAPCDSAADCAAPLVCTDNVCADPTASPCCEVGGNLLPAGTPCRPASDLCDVAETCTGSSASCPPDAFQPADTFCRSATAFQACDLADYCTGTSAVCPDIVRPAGYVCGPATGPCDEIEETCNGVSKACPLNVFSPYCQPSQGPCDVVDDCAPEFNPNYPECPADTVEPFGTVCEPPPGSPMTDCQEYICDGTGYLCDRVRNRGTTYPCRPAVDECDVAELCGSPAPINPNYNPEFPSCPSTDLHQPDGTPCHTVPAGLLGTCQSGTCVQTTCKYDINCPDGEVCDTSTWHCVPKAVGTGQGAPCTGVNGSIIGNCTGGTFCCADMEGDGVGSYAGAGQTGRCAECCGNQQSTIDDCDPGFECCDGRCIDVGSSVEHCGGCTPGSNAGFGTGVDCRELENGCYRSSICDSGECLFTSQCTQPGDVCILPSETCTDNIFCFGNALVDPLCTSGWPDFPGCNYVCGPDPDPIGIPASCLNFGCNSDDDCCQDLVCRATCSTRDYGFCLGSRTCQVP